MTDGVTESPDLQRASRRRRAVAVTGQVAGAVGIAISLLLIVVALLARGWVVDTAYELANGVNTTIARADPLLDIAEEAVTRVGDRVTDLATSADEVATTTNPTPEALVPIQQRLATMTERYLALREGYAALRGEVASAADRVRTIARVVPFVTLPTGPAETLGTVDQRLQTLDDRIMRVVEAGGLGGAVDRTAAAIAERAREAEAALTGATDALNEVQARLDELEAKVTGVAETVDAGATLVTLVVILLLVYLAFLHLVLFRVSRQYQEAPTSG